MTATAEATYRTAEQELSDALEGTAPHLARELAELLGPTKTAQLATVVRRALAVGIRRRAAEETADRLVQLYDLLEYGLEHVDPDCVSPEVRADV